MGELHFVLLLPTITNILNKGMARLLTLGPVWWKTLATNATGVWRTRDDWHGGAADALKGAAFDETVARLRC